MHVSLSQREALELSSEEDAQRKQKETQAAHGGGTSAQGQVILDMLEQRWVELNPHFCQPSPGSALISDVNVYTRIAQ